MKDNKVACFFRKMKTKYQSMTVGDKISLILVVSLLWIEILFCFQWYFDSKVLKYDLTTGEMIKTAFGNSLFFQAYSDAFMDYFNVLTFLTDNNPYAEPFNSSYPPLALLIAKGFKSLADVGVNSNYYFVRAIVGENFTKVLAFVLFVIVAIILTYFFIYKILKKQKTFKNKTGLFAFIFTIMVFLTAPYLYLFNRGNFLSYAFVATLGFFAYYDSESKVAREFSIILLAIAGGIKIYPLAFGLILLKDKKSYEIIRLGIYFVVIFLLSFLAFKGGMKNFKLFLDNMTEFKTSLQIVVINGENYSLLHSNNLSFSTAITVLITLFGGTALKEYAVASTLSNFLIVYIFILAFAVCFTTNKKWKISLIAALLTILIPSPSYIYAGVMLIIPLILFLFEKEKGNLDYAYMVLFIIALSPLQFGYLIQPLEKGHLYGVKWSNVLRFLSYMAFIVLLSIESIKKIVAFIKAKKSAKEVEITAE